MRPRPWIITAPLAACIGWSIESRRTRLCAAAAFLNRYLEARFERQMSVPGVFGSFAEVLQNRHQPEDAVERLR